MRRAGGYLWMAGAIAAVIAFQLLRTSPPLAALDAALNSARPLLPVTIGLAVGGGLLLLFAAAHGLATDAAREPPGPVATDDSGPGTAGGVWVGRFRGRLLGGASFEEESRFGELKRAWATGRWLTDRRLFRATLVMAGLPLVVVGAFASTALAVDNTGIRVVVLAAVLYSLVRLGRSLGHA